jgi:hypothetical protein
MNLKENISRIKEMMGILIETSLPEQIKNDAGNLFNNNSKLSSIGTTEQYSQYLNTIFPDSKVKGIFYHSTSKEIERFNESFFGIYFSYSPMEYYGNIIVKAILDVKNPLVTPESGDSQESIEMYYKEYKKYLNPISFSPTGETIYKYDGSIEKSSVAREGIQIRVRNPNQIHILGSEDDIIGFENYVNK